MSIRIYKEAEKPSYPTMLQDGQIAVIREAKSTEFIGTVVQRFGNHLIHVGRNRGCAWSDYFLQHGPNLTFGFEILPKGTLLEIE
jgi:hypothetical protein